MGYSNRVEKIKYDLISPFGPSIMVGTIPDSIYDEFSEIIHRVIEEKQRSHTKQLSGRLDEEWTVERQELFETRTEEFMTSIVNKYCTDLLERLYSVKHLSEENDRSIKEQTNIPIEVLNTGGWVNNMGSYEYNPVHYHPFCNITTVFYFNSIDGDFIDEIIAPTNTERNHNAPPSEPGNTDDGMLEIIYNSSHYFELGTMRIKPKEKQFLIFPAHLLHQVYPFISNKKRISASFNFTVNADSQIINYGAR